MSATKCGLNVIAVVDISSSSEADSPAKPPPSSNTRTHARAVLVSPPLSSDGPSARPRERKLPPTLTTTTRKGAVPARVIEISDSSGVDEVEDNDQAKGNDNGKARAVHLDSDDDEPSFLRDLDADTRVLSAKAKRRLLVLSPHPPVQYDHDDPDFDGFWADDEAPGKSSKARGKEKEPTQGPTPPAQNPTPPPPPPADWMEIVVPDAAQGLDGAAAVRSEDDAVADDEHPSDNVGDPTSTAIASILEIIPQVDADHLAALVEQHLPTYGQTRVVEFVLHHLFENPGYPSASITDNRKGKRKSLGDYHEHEGGASAAKKVKIDYASEEREFVGGVDYTDLALGALQRAFPFIPLPYLRLSLAQKSGLYAPTHLFLLQEEDRVETEGEGVRKYAKKKIGGVVAGKGKGREMKDEAFEAEKRWLDARLARGADPVVDDDDEWEEVLDDGTFIECGCCFGDFPFERMAQCPDAHLFCRACLRAYASIQLGAHNTSLTCMHTASSCKLAFAPSELARLLPSRLLSLYERLKQQKELKDAALEGLEECPFCEYACVMDVGVEEDRLFRCGNVEGGCGTVSCRMCRKKEHVPRTCKEVEEDMHLEGRLGIEEAMTRALMRNCPKCEKAFIKENGCNKMTCPNCRTLSCYVCRALIRGYDHFLRNDPLDTNTNAAASSSTAQTRCPLWDTNLDQRHDQEVKQAYQKALAEYTKAHPEVQVGKDIKVDLPVTLPDAAVGNVPVVGYVVPEMYGLQQQQQQGEYGRVPPPPAMLDVRVLEREMRLVMERVDGVRRRVEEGVRRVREVEMAVDAATVEVKKAKGAGELIEKRKRRPVVGKDGGKSLTCLSKELAAEKMRVDKGRREVREGEEEIERVRVQVREREREYERWRAEHIQRVQMFQQQRQDQQERIAIIPLPPPPPLPRAGGRSRKKQTGKKGRRG